MFALRQTVFACLILLALNQLSDGLTCYSCAGCNDPFSANNAQTTTVPDNQGYSCRKVSALFYVTRDAVQSCSPVNIIGNGRWCCQTNLCNNANKIISRNSIILAIGLAIVAIVF